jgi:hypothetical protein
VNADLRLMPPDPFLAGHTGRMIARHRETRDAWAADPGMRAPLGTSRRMAELLTAEFPGQPAGRIVAATASGLASAREQVSREHGIALSPSALMTLLAVAAVFLLDGEGGHDGQD